MKYSLLVFTFILDAKHTRGILSRFVPISAKISYSNCLLGEEFKQLCRDFVTIETEHAEFMELKTNLEEAAEALGIENASLKEIRDAIQEK